MCLLALLALCAVQPGCSRPKATGAGPNQAKGQGAAEATAVVVSAIEVRDVAEWVEAVGIVTPLSSVAVVPQVDGRLLSVNFVEGQLVARGQVLAQVDPRPYLIARDNAKAAVTRDRATMVNAELNAKRYHQLRGQKMVSDQQLTDQEASVASGRAVLLADQAQLAQAELQLDYAAIKSPVAGRAGFRRIDAGNVVRAGSGNALVVVNQVAPIAVTYALPQDLLAQLQEAETQHPLLTCVYRRDGQALLGQSEQLHLDNEIDAGSGTIRLKAVLPNEASMLWPNQYVKARLRLRSLPQQQVVPAAAIAGTEKQRFVFVEQAGTAHRCPVEVALWLGSEVALSRGPAADANLIVEGLESLSAGDKVRVVPEAGAASPVQKVRGQTP